MSGPTPSNFREPTLPARLVLLIAALVLSTWVLGFATRGFFSGDSGVKLAQSHALLASGFSSRALPYDDGLDPSGQHRPYGNFLISVDGRFYGIYSWVFTGLAVPPIAVLGVQGTQVLPLLGGLLLLLAMTQLFSRTLASPTLAACTATFAVFATPIVFYAAQFTEHTLAAGLCALALAVLAQPEGPCASRSAAAGACVALAATLRPEAYCAVSALGIALLFQPADAWRARITRALAYLASSLAILGVYWGVNFASLGTWSPVVLRHGGQTSSPLNAATLLIGKLPDMEPWLWLATLPALIGLAWLARWLGPARGRSLLHGLTGLAIGWLAFRAHSEAAGRTLAGLFAVTPLAAYGLLADPRDPRLRAGWLFSLLFILQVLLMDSSGTAGGLQLGARFLMPALPILIGLALAVALEDWRLPGPRWSAAAATVVLAGLALQSTLYFARGVPTATAIAHQGWIAAQHVTEAPARVVVAQNWWESQLVTPALLSGKQIYVSHGNPARLFDRLAGQGVSSLLHVGTANPAMRLPRGRSTTLVQEWPGLFPVQLVEIHEGR